MALATFINMLKVVGIMVAGMLLGNMFLEEVKKSRRLKEPWYKPYMTLPGALVIFFCIVFPIIIWIVKNSAK